MKKTFGCTLVAINSHTPHRKSHLRFVPILHRSSKYSGIEIIHAAAAVSPINGPPSATADEEAS